MTKPKQVEPKLGNPAKPEDERDAIHIAVVPVIAGDDLWPGEMLKFETGSREVVVGANTRQFSIGIVDPFFDCDKHHGCIKRGMRFWMCMYPYTITSLRHDWTHPAFSEPTVENAIRNGERIRQVTAALIGDEKWLREFAQEMESTYEELIKSAHAYLDSNGGEYHVLPYSTPDISPEKTKKFWENFEAVTGRSVEPKTKEEMFFSCSC